MTVSKEPTKEHSSYDLSIKLFLDKTSDQKIGIRILRQHLSTSISDILYAMENSDPIYTTTLKSSNLYEGWKELYAIASSLNHYAVDFRVVVNNKERQPDYINELKSLILAIDWNDIH